MADVLRFDNSRIIFQNFSGRETAYNRAGDRNFAVVIENEEDARKLAEDGWNVKITPSKRDEGEMFCYLPVKVKFSNDPHLQGLNPNVYLKTGNNMIRLDAETISCLDSISIENVDMDIRPYDWELNGKSGRAAYLQGMCVTQKIDRFGAMYEQYQHGADIPNEVPDEDEIPF